MPEIVWSVLVAAFLGAEALALLNRELGDTFSEWVWSWPMPARVVLAIVLAWAAWHFVSGSCWPLCAPGMN